MALEPTVRLSDAEREQVVDRLSTALSEGRLDVSDFQQRIDAAYAAKTHGEVAVLTADLPHPTRPRARRHRWRRRYGSWFSVNAVVWSIWGAQVANGGSVHDLWPLWVTIATTAFWLW